MKKGMKQLISGILVLCMVITMMMWIIINIP